MIEIAVEGEIRIHRHHQMILEHVVIAELDVGSASLQIAKIFVVEPVVGISQMRVGVDMMLAGGAHDPCRTVVAAEFGIKTAVAGAVGKPLRPHIHRMDVTSVGVLAFVSAKMVHIVFVIGKRTQLPAAELIDCHHVKVVIHKRRLLIVLDADP